MPRINKTKWSEIVFKVLAPLKIRSLKRPLKYTHRVICKFCVCQKKLDPNLALDNDYIINAFYSMSYTCRAFDVVRCTILTHDFVHLLFF